MVKDAFWGVEGTGADTLYWSLKLPDADWLHWSLGRRLAAPGFWALLLLVADEDLVHCGRRGGGG